MHVFLGQIMEAMLYKKQRHGIPLPPDLDRLENELAKRLEGPGAALLEAGPR